MKKLLAFLLVFCMAFALAGCDLLDGLGKKETTDEEYSHATAPTEPPRISDSVLENNLANCVMQIRGMPFTISVGELLRKAVTGMTIRYYTLEEALNEGIYSSIEEGTDTENIYVAVVSGEVMQNPDIPYMTTHEDKAMVAWMQFDDNQQVINYNVTPSSTLELCALLIVT